MSLLFSARQMEVLADSSFLNKLRDILATGVADPAATRAALESAKGAAELREQVAQAQRHGLTSELDIARYVITAWLLGPDFDRRFPAMAEVLASDRLMPSQKTEALERISITLLEMLGNGASR